MTAKKTKQFDDRLKNVEQWIDHHEMPLSHQNISENLNFLVDTIREYKSYMDNMREEIERHRNTLNSVGQFMDEKEIMDDWKEYFEKKQKEAEEASIKSQEDEEADTS